MNTSNRQDLKRCYAKSTPITYSMTGIKIPKTIDKKILKIDAHYIKARYKEDRFNTKIYNRRSATALLKDTKAVIKWVTKKMKLEE